ncbi:MAG: PQQ-dependent sugar dehydrogenase [Verrucomicrobiota bacterium]|nr:PQQ-dependent sugar dehydrogenase [Verrucomicrobiota bacterium]
MKTTHLGSTLGAFPRACHVLIQTAFFSLLFLAAPLAQAGIDAELIATGFDQPLGLATPPGDTNRLFVIEQTGKIKIIQLASRTVNATPFIDVSDKITALGNEQGLLGLTFDPNYAVNGRFYIAYTAPGGSFGNGISHIAQLTVSANPDIADPASERTLVKFDQPQTNHNSGWMSFSPRPGDEGNLYIHSGDGGHFDDTGIGHIEPGGNAQNTRTLLGKILRIHIEDEPGTYSIPANNPFFGSPTEKQEIWLWGLRNPWRNSFDRKTGDMYLGDVGQGEREEIDIQKASNPGGGENYGWRVREGFIQNPRFTGEPTPPGAVDPIFDYPHTTGQTVIGGFVYRGRQVRDLRGLYVFADYLGGETGTFTGKIWTLRYDGVTASDFTDITADLFPTRRGNHALINPTSFGEDAAGELYLTAFGGGTGSVFKIVRGR